MNSVKDKAKLVRACAVSIVLSIAFVSASLDRLSAQDQKASGSMYSAKRMADGKQWTTQNLNVNTLPSYCYDDAEVNCRRYGRLYTWESARRGCQLLGEGWRLPTNDEWREMAKQYGGLLEESEGKAKAAYAALLIGGSSGFNAVLGGGRTDSGAYARLEAHGIYWTASESDPTMAWLYNFGKGSQFLNRHRLEKAWAFSVRCIKE